MSQSAIVPYSRASGGAGRGGGGGGGGGGKRGGGGSAPNLALVTTDGHGRGGRDGEIVEWHGRDESDGRTRGGSRDRGSGSRGDRSGRERQLSAQELEIQRAEVQRREREREDAELEELVEAHVDDDDPRSREVINKIDEVSSRNSSSSNRSSSQS